MQTNFSFKKTLLLLAFLPAAIAGAQAQSITQQPVNQTITAGQSASFSVTVSGSGWGYRWLVSSDGGKTFSTMMLDYGIYSGTQTSTLTLTNVPVGYSGYQFQCWILNQPGGTWVATSNAATLTVNSPTTPPVITQQPSNRTVAAGQNTTLSVAATGAVWYRWYVSITNGSSWVALYDEYQFSGAYTSTLTITNVPANFNGRQYRCAVSNEYGTTTSSAATLTVTTAPPVFTTDPANRTITEGENTSFTVAASGIPAPNYLWQVSTDNGSNWNNVSGSIYSGISTATLTLTNVPIANNGYQYRCYASNGIGGAYSKAATLTVNAQLPVITQQPVNQTITAGQNASFSVTVSGSGWGYRWLVSSDGGKTFSTLALDYGIYSGTQTSTLTLTNVPEGYSGYQFQCWVLNQPGGTWVATSNAATLTVNAPLPVITTQPSNTTVTAGPGQSATFSVAATGAASYRWYVHTTMADMWLILEDVPGQYTGAATATLTLLNVPAHYDGWQFRCEVSNSTGSITSNAATLTVTAAATAPVITTQPSNSTITEGQNASFSAAAKGDPAPTYQWQVLTTLSKVWQNVSDDLLYSGAKTATLTLTNVPVANNSYQYRCVATNSAGNATSNAATLTVNAAKKTVTVEKQNGILTEGEKGTVSFSLTTENIAAGSYQVKVANLPKGVTVQGMIAISDRGTSPLRLEGSDETKAGTTDNLQLFIDDVASDLFSLTISPPAFVAVTDISGVPEETTAGVPLTLTGNVTPSNATNQTITWSLLGSTPAGIASVSGNTLNTTGAGTVTVRANIANGAAQGTDFAAKFDITVNAAVTAPAITTQPADRTITEGQNTSFSVAASGNPAPTWQWQVSTNGSSWNNVSNGGIYSGATTATLALTNVPVVNNGYQYRCVATNSAGNATSNAATLAVNVAFVPVTGITNVPASTTTGTQLALTGTVNPANATHQAIVWSVQNAGGTGASITGSTLNTQSAGTAKITATIANGAAEGTDYTQDFDITVNPATGLAEICFPGLKVYPNPFTDVVQVSGAEGCMLRVINAAGVSVHIQQLSSFEETLPLGRLPKGVYFFRMDKNGEGRAVKVVKD